jgi:hypothetical protein
MRIDGWHAAAVGDILGCGGDPTTGGFDDEIANVRRNAGLDRSHSGRSFGCAIRRRHQRLHEVPWSYGLELGRLSPLVHPDLLQVLGPHVLPHDHLRLKRMRRDHH